MYTRKDAFALRSRIEGQMREGTPPVSELLVEFLDELALNGQHNTARTYRALLKPLRDLDALDEPTCRRLQAARASQSRNTVRTFTAALQSFCQWMTDRGYLIESPARRLMAPKPAKSRYHGRFLRQDELRRIWAVSAGDDALIVRLLLTGLRASELCRLRWADVSGDTARIVGKGETVRTVYLDDETRALLEARPRTRPEIFGFTVTALELRINKLGRRAGIRLRPHLFRHTWATWAKLGGMDDSALQQLGGWSSDRMIKKIYAVSAQQEAALDRAREAQLTRRMLEE